MRTLFNPGSVLVLRCSIPRMIGMLQRKTRTLPYRIGIYCETDVVELARFLHRKDIYRIFP
jgi:hypothetical protein